MLNPHNSNRRTKKKRIFSNPKPLSHFDDYTNTSDLILTTQITMENSRSNQLEIKSSPIL